MINKLIVIIFALLVADPRGFYLAGIGSKSKPDAFCGKNNRAFSVAVCGVGDENWQRYFLGVRIKKSF